MDMNDLTVYIVMCAKLCVLVRIELCSNGGLVHGFL